MPEPAAPDLTLFAESSWMSPWVFHALIALEELLLPYKLEVVSLPIPDEVKARIQPRSLLAKVPILIHGDLWITESLAISEYLAEAFPAPAHPRLLPAGAFDRARARQLMMYLRTSLFALREARPTSSVFGRPTARQMSPAAQADAEELVRVAHALIPSGRTTIFEHWCIADCDLALALMRLVAHQDSLDHRLADYALAQFDRTSVRRFIAHLPTAR